MKFTDIVVAGAALLLLCACKPTEKNYKEAYDKAFEAARQKAQEETTGALGNRLENMEGSRLEVVDGDTLLIGSKQVKPFEAEKDSTGRNVGVAIARYTQPTNARRQLKDVKREYPEALAATDGDDSYYVMIKRVNTLPEAAAAIRVYQAKYPDYPFIGLNGRPLILMLSE